MVLGEVLCSRNGLMSRLIKAAKTPNRDHLHEGSIGKSYGNTVVRQISDRPGSGRPAGNSPSSRLS